MSESTDSEHRPLQTEERGEGIPGDDLRTLTNQASRIAEAAAATQQVLVESMTVDKRVARNQHRRQLALIAVLCLFIGFLSYRSVFVVGPILDRQNAAQESLDTLTQFVEEVEADRKQPDPELVAVFTAVFELRQLACATDDPVRIKACAELVAATSP